MYKAKPNKKVLILGSVHSTVEIEKNDTHTSETIRFDNSTKFGVDVTDKTAGKYNLKSSVNNGLLLYRLRWLSGCTPCQIKFFIVNKTSKICVKCKKYGYGKYPILMVSTLSQPLNEIKIL